MRDVTAEDQSRREPPSTDSPRQPASLGARPAITTGSKHGDDRSVVRVIGEIDIANSSQLRSTLEAAARVGGVLEVDLDQATFFDATGLAALVSGRKAAIGHGGSLVLTNVPPFLRRLLVITGLDSVLTAVRENRTDQVLIECACDQAAATPVDPRRVRPAIVEGVSTTRER